MRLLTTTQVSICYNVSVVTVGNWCRDGLLPYEREGRAYMIPWRALLDFRTCKSKLDRDMLEAYVGTRPRRACPSSLYTTEAAEMLYVSPHTVRHWCRTGRLPAQKSGRHTGAHYLIERRHIEDMAEQNRGGQK